MALVEWQLDGTVAVVTLNDGENRFNPDFLSAFSEALNRIEADTPASALLVRSAHEKIFCNGIDLDWLVPQIQGNRLDTCKAYFYQLNGVFKKLNHEVIQAIDVEDVPCIESGQFHIG
jgi:enoyl-CoA hydratase/carnithine racemase